MTCLNCKSDKFKKEFKSFSGVNFKICAKCKCVYQDPIIETNYSDSYWQGAIDRDGIQRDFTTERDFKIKNWYGDIINFLNKDKKELSILDIGCGLGFFLSGLNNNYIKHGIESSKFATDFAKKNFSEINIINGVYQDIKNFNKKFDIIMFYHVIEHLQNPPEAIKYIKEHLKKDGILIVGTPNTESFVAKFFGKNFRHYTYDHPCLYSESALITLLKENNFKIIKKEKPFWSTSYNNIRNYFKLLFPNKLSPAFYGSIFTLYCKKNNN
jgi:2-polyprenyl-3-methyl-5-hydroxy-6-metoxy-1,4-benzoquinol methylase